MNEFYIALVACILLTVGYNLYNRKQKVPQGNVMNKEMADVYEVLRFHKTWGRGKITITDIFNSIILTQCNTPGSKRGHIYTQLQKLVKVGKVKKEDNKRYRDDFYYICK